MAPRHWAWAGGIVLFLALLGVALVGWLRTSGSVNRGVEFGYLGERVLSVTPPTVETRAMGAWPSTLRLFPVHSLPVNGNLPPTFVYPTCQLVPPVNQGACQTCTGFSALAMLANRWGLLQGQTPQMLSVQQFLDDTGTACSTTLELGVVLQYATERGLVAAAQYPYAETSGDSTTYEQWLKGLTIPPPRCFATGLARFYSGWRVGDPEHQQQIQRVRTEIYAYGPVVTTLALYPSLSSGYRATNPATPSHVNVYTGPSSGDEQPSGYHAVLVIGWGEGYWICTSSWGTTWPPGALASMPGAFFVASGQDVCRIEREMMVAYPYMV